jgi:outer membrane protein OmpA-like peptidoglycan-associated protein
MKPSTRRHANAAPGLRRLYVGLTFSVYTLASASAVTAEPRLRFHGTAAAAQAVGGYQRDEFSTGAAVQAGPDFFFMPQLSLGIKGTAAWLTPGNATDDPTIRPKEGASLYGGALTVTTYPFAHAAEERTSFSAAGLWGSVSGGAATTGQRTRATLDALAGWDLWWPDRSLGLGPTLGLLHVFQPDDDVRPADANVAMLGLHARFWVRPPAPPSDRDHDRLADKHDRCPDQAEDRDGFEDQDGCPDLDDDKDGVSDTRDRCPKNAEDRDGFQDDDGCADPDNDTDGVLDAADKCPAAREDQDGFHDDDGCPDPDNDTDGVPDVDDLCPNEPETVNDYADSDGCPDEKQVRVVGSEILLDEVVHFPSNSAAIGGDSYALLGRLAKLLREHREYIHIRIDGHADVRGPEAHNQVLSAARARAVLEFLVKNGVEPQRLSSQGFGSERPLIPGETPRAYSLNRRVEIVVTRAAPEASPSPAPAGTDPNKPQGNAPAGAAPSPSTQPPSSDKPADQVKP